MSLRRSPTNTKSVIRSDNHSQPLFFHKNSDGDDGTIESASTLRNDQHLKHPKNQNNGQLSPYIKVSFATFLLIGFASLLLISKERSQIRLIKAFSDDDSTQILSKIGVEPFQKNNSHKFVKDFDNDASLPISIESINNDKNKSSEQIHMIEKSADERSLHNNDDKQNVHPTIPHIQNENKDPLNISPSNTNLNLQTDPPWNQFALSPGELPGYTGWARPEQTLAGYFEITSSSHPTSSLSSSRYHSVVNSGDKFTLMLTCNHNPIDIDDGHSNEQDDTSTSELLEPPYICPPDGGSLFYVRAYGPSVITGNVTDHYNTSYSMDFYPIDPGDYTVEVVVTFSVPLRFEDFPIDREKGRTSIEDEVMEPGYEGYLVAGFPMLIRVNPVQSSHSTIPKRSWCNITQLTESSPSSSLVKGHWKVIDHVSRKSHQPLTPDETAVSLDGYRMGLNSVGVRMHYVYEDCDVLHIPDIFGRITGDNTHLLDACSKESISLNSGIRVGSEASTKQNIDNNVRGANFGDRSRIHVIFIGDSVMKLEMGFFSKLVKETKDDQSLVEVNITLIETNGGIHTNMDNIITTLNEIRVRDEMIDRDGALRTRRAILFNTGLHDIDVLCSSVRYHTRNVTNIMGEGESCVDAYRDAMMQLVAFIDDFDAEVKAFRTTTAGWQKYGNYGFAWPAAEMQPMSRSPHLVFEFNIIAIQIMQNHSKNIHIIDGYWVTLPRPDHTQTSDHNLIGKHLVHPGYEVLSLFARRWFHFIVLNLCDGLLL